MVSFLHAADVHLGIHMPRFGPDIARRIREARFQSLDELLRHAQRLHVDFVVLAGDLFDDHAVDHLTARRAFEILSESPVPVYVIPGNHDPYLAGSVWDRQPWNDPNRGNLHLLVQRQPVQPKTGVVLFPCPLFQAKSRSDPTSWIKPEETNRTTIRIGIAHGSLNIRPNLPEDDHLIAADAVTVRDLDYLALGHWHRRQTFPDGQGVARTAYSGVSEPMRFPDSAERTGWQPYSGTRDEFLDSGKGEALHVTIDRPKAIPRIEPVEIGRLIWQDEKHCLRSEQDLAGLINDIARRDNPERRLLRLQLTGILDAKAMLRLDELHEIFNRYVFAELDRSSLYLQPDSEEIRQSLGDGLLQRVWQKLQNDLQKADTKGRRTAERAILLMYQIIQELH
ncbi:MAG: metallophosphoesterase [Gemmatales bacterium]|nr:MAG: metallophosphoesterase [Gemmatales bacterium]